MMESDTEDDTTRGGDSPQATEGCDPSMTEENSPRKLQATTLADLNEWVNGIIQRINNLQEGMERVDARSRDNEREDEHLQAQLDGAHDRISQHESRIDVIAKNTASSEGHAELREDVEELESWQETIMEVQSENRDRIEQLEDAWKDAGAREEVVTDGDGEEDDSGSTHGAVWPLTVELEYRPRGNQDPTILVDVEDETGRTLRRQKLQTVGEPAETFKVDTPPVEGELWDYPVDTKLRDEQMVYDVTGRFYDVDAGKAMYQLHDEDEEYNPITVSAANVEETWEYLGWGDTGSPEEISTNDAHTETDP